MQKRMLSVESGDNRVLRSEIVLPDDLNACSLAELDAGIGKQQSLLFTRACTNWVQGPSRE